MFVLKSEPQLVNTTLVRPYLGQHREVSAPHGDLLGDLPGQTDGGVDDVVAVQDEDAEDEEALAGGEDDVQRQHHLVGPSISLEGVRGQPPDGESEVGDHGAEQEEKEDGVTEDLGQPSLPSTTTVAQLACRLATGVQL